MRPPPHRRGRCVRLTPPERSLQASVSCLANNGHLRLLLPPPRGAKLHAQGVDPNNDNLCSLLSCIERESGPSIRDGVLVPRHREGVRPVGRVRDGLRGPSCPTCATWSANAASTMTPPPLPPPTSTGTFCMAEAREAGNFALPDFARARPRRVLPGPRRRRRAHRCGRWKFEQVRRGKPRWG